MIAPGHSFVWSSPRAPMILAKSLMLKDQALRFKLSADPRLYSWTWGFVKECTAGQGAPQHAAQASSRRLFADRAQGASSPTEAIDYDRNDRGILYLHRSQRALDAGVEHMKLLESDGQIIKVLDRDQVIALDPALAHAQGADRRRHPLPDRRDRGLREIHPSAGRQDRRTRRRNRNRARLSAGSRPRATRLPPP